MLNLVFLYIWSMFSENFWSCLKEVKPVVMFDAEHRMALELMQGNRDSSRDDIGYTDLFSSCCAEFGVPLDLGQFSWVITGVPPRKSSHLLCLMQNGEWLWSQCRGIRAHLA